MGVIRVEHNENYTTMSNYHLRDRRLSLRAMGLMSKMLSLPDDWDYTVNGLSSICREGRDAVRKALQELEKAGYLVREQTRAGGCFGSNDYTLFEHPLASPLTENPSTVKPSTVNPSTENPSTDSPLTGNPTQLNNEYTKRLNNKNIEVPSWMPVDVLRAILDYCKNDDELLTAWMGYAKMRQRIKKPVATVETVYRNCAVLDKHSKGDRAYKIGMLHKAEDCSWRGLFPLKEGDEGYNAAAGTDRPAQGEANERRPERWN